jgi:hypothetical protein
MDHDMNDHQPDDVTVEALGSMSKALETIERVRGHLYSMHQLTGTADLELDHTVELLRQAGHDEWAKRIQTELVGLNVIPGHWTFQLVEEFDDGYYATFRALADAVRDETMLGRRHVLEAELKERRRTHGRPGHEARPGAL